jgi:hypothetical protein
MKAVLGRTRADVGRMRAVVGRTRAVVLRTETVQTALGHIPVAGAVAGSFARNPDLEAGIHPGCIRILT